MRPEDAIQKHIVDMMRTIGFSVWETPKGRAGGTRTTPGIPDLIIAGHGRTLFVEVKTPKGVLSQSQCVFGYEWDESGGTWLVWRSDGDAWEWCVSEGIIVDTTADKNAVETPA